ncbi:MAG: radical SAM protein [Dissulfuribacterales bacterium]
MKTLQRWNKRNPLLNNKTGVHGRGQAHLLHNETGAIRKTWGRIGKSRGITPVALIFPNTYAVGMSNLGLQTLYATLNAQQHIAAERFFYHEGSPWKSEESGRPLNDFQILLFSVSFEADYPNVIRAISACGLSPLAADRENEKGPLVLAGGVATFINPEPLAPFIDAFLLGEFEAISPDFLPILKDLADTQTNRKTRLELLAGNCHCVYVPNRFSTAITPARQIHPMETVPHTRIISGDAAFSNMFLLELARGCGKGCRFCAAGFVYRPARPWPQEALLSTLNDIKGTDKIGLVGLEFLQREDINHICENLLNRGMRLAFSSMRIDNLTDAFIEVLIKSHITTATIAPEAGSERMRAIINKNLTEETILAGIERLATAGILNFKLYFMYGLPFETPEDMEALVGLIKLAKKIITPIGQKQKHLGNITVSAGTFVPKAWTPFQWSDFIDEKTHTIHRNILIKGLSSLANVRLRLDSWRSASIQAILSRGDRTLAPILQDVALNATPWRKAFKNCKDKGPNAPTAASFLKGRDIHETLPWEAVQHSITKAFLQQEWAKAKKAKNSPSCMPGCRRCGVCN